VGFVGLFTIDIDKTRDVGKGGFRWCEEVYSGVGYSGVGVLKRVHYKENRGYLI
jgi:hypothetical protein